MIAMKTEILTASDQFVTATLNGIYQGLILVLRVALGLRLMGRTTNAATRHAIWFATLILLVLIIPAHLLRGYVSVANNDFDPKSEKISTLPSSDEEFEYDLSPALADSDADSMPAPEISNVHPVSVFTYLTRRVGLDRTHGPSSPPLEPGLQPHQEDPTNKAWSNWELSLDEPVNGSIQPFPPNQIETRPSLPVDAQEKQAREP